MTTTQVAPFRVLTTAPPGSSEWLHHHAGLIGSSMLAGIVAPGEPGAYGTPLQAWHQLKRERVSKCAEPEQSGAQEGIETDDDPEDVLAWGRDSEALHIRRLQAKSGLLLLPTPGLCASTDAQLSMYAVTPDALCVRPGDSAVRGVAELKAPTFKAYQWRNGAPLGFRIQHELQMRVLGMHWGILSAFVPPKVLWHQNVANDELWDFMQEGAARFWTCVERDTPPPPVNAEDLELVKRSIRPTEGLELHVQPGSEVMDLWLAHREWMQRAKETKEGKDAAEAALLARIGDEESMQYPEKVLFPDGSRLSIKVQRQPLMEKRGDGAMGEPFVRLYPAGIKP